MFCASGRSLQSPSQQRGAARPGKDQGCNFVPGSGSSKAVTLWSPHAETDVESSWSGGVICLQTVWERVCFLSAVVWASVAGNGLRTHGVGRGCACPGPLSWDLCIRLQASFGPEHLSSFLFAPFKDRRVCLALFHASRLKVEQIKSLVGMLL